MRGEAKTSSRQRKHFTQRVKPKSLDLQWEMSLNLYKRTVHKI